MPDGEQKDAHVPPAPEDPGDAADGADARDRADGRTKLQGDSDAAGVEAGGAGTQGVQDGGAQDADHATADDVAAYEAEVATLRDRLARARADYDNLQRRVERDAAIERERVKARVLDAFLQVYEFGKMAEFEAHRNPGPLAEGVKMMVREFDRMLEAEGLRMLGAVGEAFDPRVHEAVASEEAADVAPGHVSRVVAPGYRLGERVLRYAKVAVAPEHGEEE